MENYSGLIISIGMVAGALGYLLGYNNPREVTKEVEVPSKLTDKTYVELKDGYVVVPQSELKYLDGLKLELQISQANLAKATMEAAAAKEKADKYYAGWQEAYGAWQKATNPVPSQSTPVEANRVGEAVGEALETPYSAPRRLLRGGGLFRRR